MENQNLRIINTLGKANKSKLIKTLGHTNINKAIEHYTSVKQKKYSDEEKQRVYEIMKEDYNSIVRIFQEDAKEKKVETKSYYKQSNDYLKSFNKIESDVIDTKYKKMKPKVEVINRFKKSSKEITIVNPHSTPDVINSFDSVSILRSIIPEVMSAMKEHKNVKIYAHFHLELRHKDADKDETKDFPSGINTEIIYNIGSVRSTIEDMIATMKNRIPEIEIEKSGWLFQRVIRIIVNIMKYAPLKGGSYIDLPKELKNKKCCINIKNEDDKCLRHCVSYHIHQDEILKDPQRPSHYDKY